MSDELFELKKISKILILTNAKTIEEELSKFASTNERKKIWVLIDGKRTSKDISTSIGITIQAVNRFLRVLETAELILGPSGKPPTRILDYVPASWIDLVKFETKGDEAPKDLETKQIEEAKDGNENRQ